jgi:CRP-like cAMP-binding protein
LSQEELLQDLNRKLDILLRLVATQVGADLSVAERAPLLSRTGLDRKAIADVCNTTPEAVSVRLAEARKRKTARAGR